MTGADGNPLVGIAVVLDGTTRGTLTDVDGNWTLDVENPEEAVIVFSCVGFSTETVPLDGRTVLNLTMKENAELLDEVVVVGYGTQKKVNVTGSVTSIDFGKEQEGRPILSTSSALAGMAPGMSVMQRRIPDQQHIFPG